eukprot:6359637-Pyramimonas_sp.AAC.1
MFWEGLLAPWPAIAQLPTPLGRAPPLLLRPCAHRPRMRTAIGSVEYCTTGVGEVGLGHFQLFADAIDTCCHVDRC